MSETKLYFEDVNEGDEAPVLNHTLTRTDLVMYAGASGDFNPMHTDEVTAKQAGQPSVFGHGMFSMGILGTALTNWLGVGNLRRYKVRFARQTWPGETLTTKIAVAGKRKEDGATLVDLECSLVNQDGEVKVAGEAVAGLPSRG
jgi:acyl dehydratase